TRGDGAGRANRGRGEPAFRTFRPLQVSLAQNRPDKSRPRGRTVSSRRLRIAIAAAAATVVATSAFAQRRGGIPVPPLPEGPFEYQTAELDIRVSVLARGLENPWSLAFLPDESILITERPGRLRHIRNGRLPGPITGMPDVVTDNFTSGLHDIKLHPDFEQTRLVYMVYNKAVGGTAAGAGAGAGGRGPGGGRVLTVARGAFDGTALV